MIGPALYQQCCCRDVLVVATSAIQKFLITANPHSARHQGKGRNRRVLLDS